MTIPCSYYGIHKVYCFKSLTCISYNLVGYTKTGLMLLWGWAVMDEQYDFMRLFGLAVTIGGKRTNNT